MTWEQRLKHALDDSLSTADRIRAVEALRALKPAGAIVPLTLQLGRVEALDAALESAIRRALGEMNATEVIAAELASSDPEARIRAAGMLALVPGPAGVAPLLRTLADPIPRVREFAAAALWQQKDAKAIDPLSTLLATDPDPDVRAAAAQSLCRLGGAAVLSVLERATESESDDFARILIEDSLERARQLPASS